MVTKVQAAFGGLQAVLEAAQGQPGSILPPLKVDAEIPLTWSGDGGFFNLLTENVDEEEAVTLGVEGSAGERNFYQRASVEWMVSKSGTDAVTQEAIELYPDDAALRARFDAGIEEIRNALVADRTLGGTVDYWLEGVPERTHQAVYGLPEVKGIAIPVLMMVRAETYLG